MKEGVLLQSSVLSALFNTETHYTSRNQGYHFICRICLFEFLMNAFSSMETRWWSTLCYKGYSHTRLLLFPSWKKIRIKKGERPFVSCTLPHAAAGACCCVNNVTYFWMGRRFVQHLSVNNNRLDGTKSEDVAPYSGRCLFHFPLQHISVLCFQNMWFKTSSL